MELKQDDVVSLFCEEIYHKISMVTTQGSIEHTDFFAWQEPSKIIEHEIKEKSELLLNSKPNYDLKNPEIN